LKYQIANRLSALTLSPLLIVVAGCHSYHIETTVENRTGAPIHLLEVDYPSASFGAETLASGADYHYRFQIQGAGPIKVQYSYDAAQSPVIEGPTLSERQQGQLLIVLLPAGKAEFQTQLIAAR
jgi:hypothetical protein